MSVTPQNSQRPLCRLLQWRRSLLPATSLAACMVAVLATPANAGVYIEDFTGPNGSQPADWSPFWPGADTLTQIVDNTYQATTSSTAINKPLMGYTGGNSGTWDDYTVESTVKSSFWNSGTFFTFGLAARIQPDASAFYHADIQGGQLRIYRGTSSNAFAQLLAESPITNGYGTNSTWRMVFDVSGDSLEAWVYDGVGTLRGNVAATDSTLTAGHPGVWGTIDDNVQLVTWDNFTVTGDVVPEPTSVALAGAGLSLMVFRRRNRR